MELEEAYEILNLNPPVNATELTEACQNRKDRFSPKETGVDGREAWIEAHIAKKKIERVVLTTESETSTAHRSEHVPEESASSDKDGPTQRNPPFVESTWNLEQSMIGRTIRLRGMIQSFRSNKSPHAPTVFELRSKPKSTRNVLVHVPNDAGPLPSLVVGDICDVTGTLNEDERGNWVIQVLDASFITHSYDSYEPKSTNNTQEWFEKPVIDPDLDWSKVAERVLFQPARKCNRNVEWWVQAGLIIFLLFIIEGLHPLVQLSYILLIIYMSAGGAIMFGIATLGLFGEGDIGLGIFSLILTLLLASLYISTTEDADI